MTPAWTFARVADLRPELAPLARLHGALEQAAVAFVARGGALAPHVEGPPAVHWVHGRALMDAAHSDSLASSTSALFTDLARAAAETVPGARAAIGEILTAIAGPAFSWRERLATFRELPAPEDVPHPELFRFLLLRAAAAPASRLALEYSAPHAERWPRADCPWCGVPAAAAVAGAGSARTLLCVLCGGRWPSQGVGCVACGEQRSDTQMILADRSLGPASLEACATCRHALKVFAPSDVGAAAPVALEILTVHLDVIAQADDLARDPTALAAVFPPP
jgi:hypothetical protein